MWRAARRDWMSETAKASSGSQGAAQVMRMPAGSGSVEVCETSRGMGMSGRVVWAGASDAVARRDARRSGKRMGLRYTRWVGQSGSEGVRE